MLLGTSSLHLSALPPIHRHLCRHTVAQGALQVVALMNQNVNALQLVAQLAQTQQRVKNIVIYIIIYWRTQPCAGAKSAMRLLRPWGSPPIQTRFGLRKSASRGFHPPPKTDRRRNDPTGRLEGSEQASRQRLTDGKGIGRRAGRRQNRTDIRCRSRGHSSRHQRSRPRTHRRARVRQGAQKPGPSPL